MGLNRPLLPPNITFDARIVQPEDDPIETTLRAWEISVEAAGWDATPAFGTLMALDVEGVEAYGVGVIAVPDQVMKPPHHLLQALAKEPAATVRQFFSGGPSHLEQHMRLIGLVLSMEVWAVFDPLGIQRAAAAAGLIGSIKTHTRRFEQRRVIVATGGGVLHTLTRTRGVPGPQWGPGAPAEKLPAGAPDDIATSLVKIVAKLGIA
jgi:hypothetical protein